MHESRRKMIARWTVAMTLARLQLHRTCRICIAVASKRGYLSLRAREAGGPRQRHHQCVNDDISQSSSTLNGVD